MADLKTDLLGTDNELEETHTSTVFLGKDEVWKVKKPVDLGFLDFSTLELRRAGAGSVHGERRSAAARPSADRLRLRADRQPRPARVRPLRKAL